MSHNAECRHVTDPANSRRSPANPGTRSYADFTRNVAESRSCRATVRRHFPDLPIILLAGDLPAEKAVEYIKLGIADFVPQGRPRPPRPLRRTRYRGGPGAEAHQQAEARLLESRQFAQAALDALTARIAVLDAHGGVQAVNRAWREIRAGHAGDPAASLEGGNYLKACESAQPERAALLREVIAGRVAESVYEYQGGYANETSGTAAAWPASAGTVPTALS